MNHAEIEAEVERLKRQVSQLAASKVDDEVEADARRELAELKVVARSLLTRDEDTLAGLVSRNVEVYRDFKAKLRHLSSLLDSLLE